jgi:hypothetical protein
MTLETLKHIKSQLASLYKLVYAIARHRSNIPGYMIVAILIQNAQFKSVDCVNFDLEKEVDEIHAIQQILHLFVQYDDDSFYEFVYKEYTAIIEGNEMAEEIEKEDENDLHDVDHSQL